MPATTPAADGAPDGAAGGAAGGASRERWSRLDRPGLRQDSLRRALTGPDGPCRDVVVVPATASTNADLAERYRAGRAGHLDVLTTDHQTAGRGRLGRAWLTPARAAVTASVVLVPGGDVPRERWSWLPLLAGASVVRVLRDVCGLPAGLKWPNDVLLPAGGPGPADRDGATGALKVCGVLAEVVQGPAGTGVVLGAGLNVSQTAEELPVPAATSLLLAGSAVTDREVLLRAYLRELATGYARWAAAGGDAEACGLAAVVRETCTTLGRRVRVDLPTGPLTGEAEGVDGDGRLLVRPDGGGDEVVAVAAGDVVHVRPDGGTA